MFFVVGSARSGTTLLRMILNAHSEVAVPPESRFVVDLYDGRDEIDVRDWLPALASHRRFQTWDLPIERVASELQGTDRTSYAQATEAVYRAYARMRDKPRFGDKTPRYVEHIRLLARLFPAARFVHQIRDGRDVALSYAGVPFGPKTVPQAARLWARRVLKGRADGRILGPDRYLELRYEDLIASPKETMERLCTFLGIPFEPGMLDYRDRSDVEALPRARLFNPNVFTGKISSATSWAEDMDDTHVQMFEAVAGDVLQELGYPRRHSAPNPVVKLAANLGLLGLPIGRLKSARVPAALEVDADEDGGSDA